MQEVEKAVVQLMAGKATDSGFIAVKIFQEQGTEVRQHYLHFSANTDEGGQVHQDFKSRVGLVGYNVSLGT